MFSSNRLVSNLEVRDLDGYDNGIYSAQQAMIEAKRNEMLIFEAALLADVEEAYMVHNEVDQEEINAYTENVLTDMLDKIKEFLMKVWEKIKAIFKGWMAKLDNVMGKSNKEFVNKYRKVVMSKDLTDMTVKWRKPKDGKNLGNIHEFETSGLMSNLSTKTHYNDAQSKLDKWDEDDELCKILVCALTANSLSDSKDFEKDFIDEYLEDEEEDDTVGNNINGIMAELLTFKDTKKGIDRTHKSLEKAIKSMVKEIEKDQDQVTKANPGSHEEVKNQGGQVTGWKSKTSNDMEIKHKEYGYGKNQAGDSYENTSKTGSELLSGGTNGGKYYQGEYSEDKDPIRKYQKAIQLVYKHAILHQRAANMYTAAVMKLCKIWNSQNRKVWAAAVAYSRKEEAVMTEAMIQIAESEVDLVF